MAQGIKAIPEDQLTTMANQWLERQNLRELDEATTNAGMSSKQLVDFTMTMGRQLFDYYDRQAQNIIREIQGVQSQDVENRDRINSENRGAGEVETRTA